MSDRVRVSLALFITWRKILSTKVNVLVLSGLILLLAYFWIEDSYSLCLKAYLYLCPFLFLFFSQDMINDEIHSGVLENTFFTGGRFREYLMTKNAIVATSALGVTLILFSGLALYGLASRQFKAAFIGQFAAGVLAGIYYVAAAGLLSFFFKAGSNVLILILGQVLLLVALLLTVSQRMGFVERLTASSYPGIHAKLEFLAVSFVLPNIVIARRSWFAVLGLGGMTALLFSLQAWKIKLTELRK